MIENIPLEPSSQVIFWNFNAVLCSCILLCLICGIMIHALQP